MAQSPQFGAIALGHIAHGALATKLDEQLRHAADRLASYVTENGVDLTKKAKAEVTLKITLTHLQDGVFVVGGDVTAKAPSSPLPSRDRLVFDESGGLVMNLAPEITERDDPRQLTLKPDASGGGPRKEM